MTTKKEEEAQLKQAEPTTEKLMVKLAGIPVEKHQEIIFAAILQWLVDADIIQKGKPLDPAYLAQNGHYVNDKETGRPNYWCWQNEAKVLFNYY